MLKKRIFSGLILVCMLISLLGVFPLSATAARQFITTPSGYTSAAEVEYKTFTQSGKTYIANWGARGEDATFLSAYALSFYTGNYAYSVLSQNAGGTTQSNAPESALYNALQDMMTAEHSYLISYDATRYLYKYTDCVLSDPTEISCFYTGAMFTGEWNAGTIWNREHTWPNSKDLNGKDEDDIMMLRPADAKKNSGRGNKAYGESTGFYDPGDDVHGDCARIVLYVYTRWGDINNMWGTEGVIENLDILLQWMEEDPVDTWEMGRNDAVEAITGTRNVFVDYPEYAFQLFGEDVPEDYSTPSNPNGEGSSGTPDTPGTPETPAEPATPKLDIPKITSLADILAIGASLGDGKTTTEEYTVCGTVSNIENTTWGNMTIKDDDGNSLYIYGTYDASGKIRYDAMDAPPKVGDKVYLTAPVKRYVKSSNVTIELINARLTEVPPTPTPVKWSISMDGSIGIHAYYQITPAFRAACTAVTVEFWMGDTRIASHDIASAAPYEGELYRFSCEVGPAQMAEAVTVSIQVGDETVEGTKQTVSVNTYISYAKTAGAAAMGLDATRYAKLQALMLAMEAYRDAAVAYIQNDNSASVKEAPVANYDAVVFNHTELITFTAISATLHGKTSLHYCFDLKAGESLDGYTVNIEGISSLSGLELSQYAKKEQDGSYRLTLSGIAADQLGRGYTVTIYKNGNYAGSATASVGAYAERAWSLSTTSNSLKNLTIALMHYRDAAVAYFA